jgi:23S rRNA G2445 N2-methylase RlmL
MKVIAFLTKGLKDTATSEIREKITGAEINRSSDKYVIFNTSETRIDDLKNLRTVDDVQLLLKFEEIEDFSSENIIGKFPETDFLEKVDIIEKGRDTGDNFSLTCSKYMNDADLEEIESGLAEKISNLTGRSFTSGRESKLDLRMHLEENNLIFALRLSEKPLYFRDYWEEGRKGSLKTSIAAALCRVAEPEKGAKLVDNFCGAGTILCEASEQGLNPAGGDIDREAVKTARKNISNIDPDLQNQVKKLDATDTDQPDSYYDIAVSNLPWGKQVELNETELYRKSIKEYSRILKDDGKIVLLGKNPKLAEKYLKKNFANHSIKSFQLGFLGQTPSVTYAEPE